MIRIFRIYFQGRLNPEEVPPGETMGCYLEYHSAGGRSCRSCRKLNGPYQGLRRVVRPCRGVREGQNPSESRRFETEGNQQRRQWRLVLGEMDITSSIHCQRGRHHLSIHRGASRNTWDMDRATMPIHQVSSTSNNNNISDRALVVDSRFQARLQGREMLDNQDRWGRQVIASHPHPVSNKDHRVHIFPPRERAVSSALPRRFSKRYCAKRHVCTNQIPLELLLW